MARGNSGRLVVDIEPDLKRRFHAALATDGTTFKDWLLRHVDDYLESHGQPNLPGLSRVDAEHEQRLAAEPRAAYNRKQTSDNS